ncbi:hypothetical protein [Comamonas sp. 17RB]|uniref:hypothetical protein n=1 Tax=Comamonas sp. 17RB TaxID=3047025 RepID=UPI0024B81DFA|nr:hypothetical protein [Comamonas sp. 17RB]MDI9853947.1 hypothetical protein [Comamonas sp. 17RB]
MSDQTMFSQLYNALVGNLGTPNFQLLGNPKDFSWSTAPTGQWDPAAYQVISGMPQWSPVGQSGSLDSTLFDAVRQIFGHVTFKVSPEQQASLNALADACVQKSNAMVKANSDMNQVYLSSKQNGGLIFAARYPDINAWIDKAPEAAAYVQTIQAATDAYNQAVKMKLELERASMPSDLQRAIDMMQMPSGNPATDSAPAGWTKVPDGSGILRWQPDFRIDTTGTDWRAALSNGNAGAFSITMNSSESSSDFKSSFAKGSASVGNWFWSANASGGWSKSDLFNQDSSSSVTISCESSTRVKVNPGDWYPGGFMSELAKAQQGASGQGYTIVAPWVANGGPGTSSLFGPNGIVAARVSELLVVYKPSFEITMSANSYQQNKQAFEASAGVRIGPFTFGGSGGHESEYTKTTAKANTFSGGSTSENPQIIGVIVDFPGIN